MLKSFRGWSIALVLALIAAVLVSMPKSQIDQANAANASNWDAGYIISDENFYNGRALTSEQQVQTFLQSKNAGCVSGATCILNYREPTPTMAASAYCDRIDGRANESAASIIHRVGQACNISQMALIVLLEKEQSLITSRNPTSRQFTAATGYACPDTAPCDAGFGGFFTQVYYGARAYQYYKTHPTQYRHIAGQWNTVLYNPKASCGSSQVFIQNNATAGLYNYTPYQPNRAALSNLYGTGDTCSAYGNRNFWRLYTDWFGDPRAPLQKPLATGDVVQSTGTGDYFIYSKQDGMVRVPERKHLVSMGKQHGIEEMTSNQILAYGLSQTRVTGWGITCGSTDYFASTQKLQRFESTSVRDQYAMQFTKLPADVCSGMTISRDSVSQVATDLRGNLWVIQNGQKRPATEASLRTAGLAGKFRITLPNDFVNAMKSGAPYRGTDVTPGTVFRSTYSGDHFLYSDTEGMIRVPDKAILLSMGMHRSVSDIATERIHEMGLSRVRVDDWGIQCGSTRYFASNQNLQPFASTRDAAHYLGSYTKLPADLCAALPKSNNVMSQAARGLDGRLWIIENQTKRPASEAAIRASSHSGKYRALLPAAFVSGLPTGTTFKTSSMLRIGDVVQSSGSGDLFVYSEDDSLISVENEAILASIGLDDVSVVVDPEGIAEIEVAETVMDSWLVRCGDTVFVASEGRLHPIASDELLEHYGTEPTDLPEGLCEVLQVAEEEADRVLVDEDGQHWVLIDGERWSASQEGLTAAELDDAHPIAMAERFLNEIEIAGDFEPEQLL